MVVTPKVKPFRFWAQKVLPLVYDDSLSYYEVLCKVVDKLNSVIESGNVDSDAISELQIRLGALQTEVDALPETLDVESYISDKLDQMYADGEFDSAFESILTDYNSSTKSIVKQFTPLQKFDVLFHDNFHRANSSSELGSNGDTEFPMEYTTSGATMGIRSNSAYLSDLSSNVISLAVSDMGTPDVFAEAEVGNLENESETTRGAGVVVRYVDGNNFIHCVLRKTYVRVYERISGVSTEITNRYITSYDKVKKFGILVEGSVLTLVINGVPVTKANVTLTGTKAGIVIEPYSVATIKNFWCRKPSSWVQRYDMLKDGTIPFDVQLENDSDAYSFQFVTDPVGTDTVMRFELRKSDDYPRSEARFLAPMYPLNDSWYSLDIMLDESFSTVYQNDIAEILTQLHDTPRTGEAGGVPCFTINVKNGKWGVGFRSTEEADYQDISSHSKELDSYLSDIGKWVNWQFHIKNGYNDFQEPQLEVYKNGVLVLESKLPNTYNKPRGAYWKLGLYLFGYRDFPTVPQADKRVVFVKNVSVIS